MKNLYYPFDVIVDFVEKIKDTNARQLCYEDDHYKITVTNHSDLIRIDIQTNEE